MNFIKNLSKFVKKESENSPEIESIVKDLVNAVHIQESIMSDPEQDCGDSEESDKTSYFEANDMSIASPFDECPIEGNYKSNETLVPNTIQDFMELSKDCIEDENDYTSKRSSSSSPVSDWKYSPYSSSTNEYSKPYQTSVGKKYDDILDSWKLNKDDHKVTSKPSRTSLMRNFDPLFGKVNTPPFPSPPERRKAKPRIDRHFFAEHNDSTGLIEDFSKCKIAETPKLEPTVLLIETKPDVLEFAVQQQKDDESKELNELKDRINELKDSINELGLEIKDKESNLVELKRQLDKSDVQIKDKESNLEELKRQLDKSDEEKSRATKLVETLHNINQELFRLSTEKLDQIQSELSNALKQRSEIENKYFESILFCDKLSAELSSVQTNQNANDNQYLMAVQRVKQLEDKCNQLMAKNASMEEERISPEAKRDMENEMITFKVQNKRMEMKIKSLENQLDQKTKENLELSAMVDELIVNVNK